MRQAHRDRAQRQGAGHRDVDLAADDQQRHRQRDQRLFAEVEGAVGQVVRVEEVRQQDAADDEHGHDSSSASSVSQRAQQVAQAEGLAGRGWCSARCLALVVLDGWRWRCAIHAALLADGLTAVQRQDLAAAVAVAACVDQHRDQDHEAGQGALPEGRDLQTGSALPITARNSAPSTAPATMPTPPAMLMPPITQAAITVNSKP